MTEDTMPETMTETPARVSGLTPRQEDALDRAITARLAALLSWRAPDLAAGLAEATAGRPEAVRARCYLWAATSRAFRRRARPEWLRQAEEEMPAVMDGRPETEGGRAMKRCNRLLIRCVVQGVGRPRP